MNLFRRRKKTTPTEERNDATHASRSEDLGSGTRDMKSNEGSSMSQPNAPTSDQAMTGTDMTQAAAVPE